MNTLSYSDIVSSLALLASVTALGWNIIRDLILDKIGVDFSVTFGERGNIKNSSTALFADAGSLPNHKFDDAGLHVRIVNMGRRPIGIAKIEGQLKDGSRFFMAVDGLPKMLPPYEIFSSVGNAKENFLEKIQKDEVKYLWATDTKNKKWPLSEKGWKRLRDTADYIASGKHQSRN